MSIKDIFYKFFAKKEKIQEKPEVTDSIAPIYLHDLELKYHYKEIIENSNIDYLLYTKKNNELDETLKTKIISFLNQEDNKGIFIWDTELEFDKNGYSIFFTKDDEVIAYIQVIEIAGQDFFNIQLQYLSVKKELRRRGVAINLLAQAIAFCEKIYPKTMIFAWVDIEVSDLFFSFGFNPFIGQIEEVDGRKVSLFCLRWEL